MQSASRSGSKTSKLLSLLLMCICVCVFLAFSGPQTISIAEDTTAQSDAVLEVVPGSSIRREVVPSARAVFTISVAAGKLLRVSIDKGDLALSTTLYGPVGTKLFEHVSQEFESVELSFPVEVGGTYKIELHSRERTETARAYELRVHSLTAISALDRKDSEARQAMATAEVLRANWTEPSLRRAIENYHRAALIWTGAGESSRAARATLKSGDIYLLLSEFSEAVKRYQKAASLVDETSDWLTKATALSQAGLVYSYIGDNDLAQQQATKALELFASHENSLSPFAVNAYGDALSNLAEITYSKGNLIKSALEFERARKTFQNDRKGEAKVHLFAGYIAGSIGDPEKAMAETLQSLALYRAINNKDGEGLALTLLGLSHSSKRDVNGATRLHREAIEIFLSIGDRHSEAIARNALGQVYETVSDFPVALANYESALRLFRSSGALGSLPVAVFKVGRIYRLNGDFDRALAYYEDCLKLSRAAGKVRTQINALNDIATLYADQGRHEEVSKQYGNIQQFYESIEDRRGQATALNAYGDFLRRIGQTHNALEAYSRSLPLSEQAGDKGILIATLYNLAIANRDLGYYDVALSFINQSLKIIEELRTNMVSPDLRASYFSGVKKHYDLCVDILMQLSELHHDGKFAVDALLMSEKGRARSLIDLVGESRADIRKGAPKELLESERKLRGMLRVQAQYEMELSWGQKDSPERAEAATRLAQLRSEYQELQSQLREQKPQLLVQSTPLHLEQIQNQLRDSDTMLLEFKLWDERSYLWAVTADSFRSYQLPAGKEIEALAREVYPLITARQRVDGNTNDYQINVDASDNLYYEKARVLGQMLLGPVATQLANKRLLVVTEGALQYIPLEALPSPLEQGTDATESETKSRSLLIETNEVVALPSFSTLIALRAQESHPSSPDKLVAVLADPVFSRSDERVLGGDPSPAIAMVPARKDAAEVLTVASIRGGNRPSRLVHASEEADAISAVAPSGTTMVAKGFEASREIAMSSNLGEYQIVHFATHGFLDSEHPELSGIVLTMVDHNGDEKDGLMPLHDIYSMDLSAELTVLSACQTALGKDIKGEGLVGLAHSFMSAGSKSVVASLWKVDDRATALLMTDFYESMLQKGMPPATALRAAKLKMMREKHWSAPYYWAGFVLQGEYTNHIAVDRKPWFRIGTVVLVLVLISLGLIYFRKRRRLT